MIKSNLGYFSKIEPFGTVDGPGVRTVFFLAGCPLRCLYCHNPETWAYQNGNSLTSDEVLKMVKRYQSYYGKDGGVTFSGGEPLAQSEFLIETCALLRSNGIHVALDTSGVGNPLYHEKVLNQVDLVIYDLKAADSDLYRRITSQPIDPTEVFLSTLQRVGTPIWIRQVIVPKINDTPENLEATAQKIATLKNVVKVELLPYHTMGKAKYDKLHIAYPLEDTPAMDLELCKRLNESLILRIEEIRSTNR
ncbi:MAG TPA: pyruvate formate lyase-activating protein [Erysipelotrichaceae bacterium]|nr:pyruvate formate lyase-activating protein [Erysipelotrichaceae bacterium]